MSANVRAGLSSTAFPWWRHSSVLRSPHPARSERRSNLFGEELRLFPRGEVAALVDLVEVGEVGVRLLDPAARGREDLAGERREANRERDLRRSLAGRKGCGSSVLPVRPGRPSTPRSPTAPPRSGRPHPARARAARAGTW